MDPEEMKRRGRGISDDMSPAAIARRIDIVAGLHRTWQVLRQARRSGPVEGPAFEHAGVLQVMPATRAPTFSSPLAAIRASESHPLAPRAAADAEWLRGSHIVAASIVNGRVHMALSNGHTLEVRVREDGIVDWSVARTPPTPTRSDPAPVRTLQSGEHVWRWDAQRLLDVRVGRRLTNLFVNSFGFFVYAEQLPILLFVAQRVLPSYQLMLCWDDTD